MAAAAIDQGYRRPEWFLRVFEIIFRDLGSQALHNTVYNHDFIWGGMFENNYYYVSRIRDQSMYTPIMFGEVASYTSNGVSFFLSECFNSR